MLEVTVNVLVFVVGWLKKRETKIKGFGVMFDLYKYLKAIDVKTVDDSINKLNRCC